MYISARERLIFEILLSKKEEMTVKDLADAIDVSTRTIHRDLKELENTLKSYNLELVKKSGVGIQIVGSEENMEELRMALFQLSYNEYTPDERQTIIVCTLLEAREPVKLVSMAHDLNVTIATISNDLTKVEGRLNEFHLTVVRKRGYGVEITGDESAKRRAMSQIIAQNLNETDFLALVKENIQKRSLKTTDSISERLLGLVEKNRLITVEHAIEEVNEELPYPIADSAYIGLVVHLSLAIERILQGENINMDDAFLKRLKLEPEYKAAEKIINKLKKVFNTDIPEAEIGYITMHLQGAKLRRDKEYLLEESSFQTAVKAKSLITFIADKTGTDLLQNTSLFQGLVTHLKPALYRIKQEMGITNPLLPKIKTDYNDLFDLVREAVSVIFPELDVPDEEIAYLVMHFGSALMTGRESNDLKALVICSTGIGTSKMLATVLKREIPEITELKNASIFELNHMDTSSYDLVISTVNLPDYHLPHIVVSPIPDQEELKKVRQWVAETKSRQQKTERIPSETVKQRRDPLHVLAEMENIKHYTDAVTDVLRGFQLFRAVSGQALEGVLREACETLEAQEVLQDSDGVFDALIEREKLGGLGIPNTSLALYHARSPHIGKPSFTIYELESAVTVSAMDQSAIEINRILLLLAPEAFTSQGLEVLSTISSLIIEDQKSITRFESEEEQHILSYLTEKLYQFYDEKLQEIRRD
ncbi:mannitol operon transcriptional antiterminator [Fictibacillus solisalsi]|uniref:Mannitol operon transcriptional antiterminator n=1 Tax=Fictibacillus solisalsi TaxID=459525 RepID=A0A1H0C8Y6_9BACL|nr:BglG family transcription antiterminator [Fictibacillus solisalsi]SDN54345.1 mannitol operon transcriptional antiterminator [Fictibacillus solisalsi]